jgi:hypothetical protein
MGRSNGLSAEERVHAEEDDGTDGILGAGIVAVQQKAAL